jgi:hypothetical protein
MTLIMVGAGMVAFLSATMLAVDVGMFMVARTQSQKAADSGALAGAVALVYDNFDDRSAGGPAVQNAIVAATSDLNDVMNQQTSVVPGDVTFPTVDRIRVRVQRTTARGNPLTTFFAPLVGIDTVDIGAVATAEVSPANAATCIKPWAVPDKWWEVQTPQWDPNDELNMFYENGPNKGKPLPNPDTYTGLKTPQTPAYTGYNPSPQGPDYGLQVTLKPGNPNAAINSSHFFPIALPGGNGGSWYEENIGGCWPGVAEIGDMLDFEPGNMIGPTNQGVQTLINQDPPARWDTVNERVINGHRPTPRMFTIPVFDPYVYEESRQHGRHDFKIANFVGFFIENMQGNNVTGRIVPLTGLVRGNGPVPTGAFLKAIRLVE